MRKILSEYSAIRDAELLLQRNRRRAAFLKEPLLLQLCAQETSLRARKGLLRATLPPAEAQVEIAKDESLLREIGTEISNLLEQHSWAADELELHYRCLNCLDTGYEGEKKCACFERRLFERAGKLSNLPSIAKENFNAFDLSVFPEEGGQREGMRKIRDFSLAYADCFPQAKHLNIILRGNVGVGKSFLLNCIAARVVERGFSVRKLTAYQFIQMTMDMIRGGDGAALRELERVDLMILDDLGSEPQIKNITTEQLYAVLDERLIAQRHTLFATNLDTDQLKDRYGERMVSRLLDTRITFCARLHGKDIRLLAQRAQK